MESTASWDTIGGWEDYLLYDVAEKVCAADESDGRPWAKLKAESWQRIASASSTRDEALPERFRDVRRLSALDRAPWRRLPRP